MFLGAQKSISLPSTSNQGDNRVSFYLPVFLKHAQYELSFSPRTVVKYEECLKTIIKHLGDLRVTEITQQHIVELKEVMVNRGAGESRLASLIFALKSFLKYVDEYHHQEVMDYKKIKTPRRPKREVLFLTNEEIEQFVNSIKLVGCDKRILMRGVRLRTLVEVLLGTGMRISEALSLNRDSINFEKAEAKIIGKGNKEREVYFTERSLDWVKYYLSHRKDNNPALFATEDGTRFKSYDVSYFFRKQVKKAGMDRKITPHILRHTVATNLLFNGCPISHVKEILGHADLQTTCKYYLGVDKRKAKEAHSSFLKY